LRYLSACSAMLIENVQEVHHDQRDRQLHRRLLGRGRLRGVRRHAGRRRGAFVAETSGGFDHERARWMLTVIPGTGTDELAGLEGSGTFEAPHGGSASFDFDYQLG